MRRIVMAIAAVGVVAGSLVGAQSANAAQTNNGTTVNPNNSVPIITALNCEGGTGAEGCGPGFIWRDGWRGMGCYPC